MMMEPYRTAARNSMLGFVGSGVAGIGIARYLANPANAMRYRPKTLGQVAIVFGAALIGGKLVSMYNRPPHLTAAQLIEGNEKQAASICRGMANLAPCMDDAECRAMFSHRGASPMLSWYEACRQQASKVVDAAAPSAPSSDVLVSLSATDGKGHKGVSARKTSQLQ